MAVESGTIEVPNVFELAGEGITVSVTLSTVSVPAAVAYHDPRVVATFGAGQVTVEQTALGTLVTVVTVPAVDTGYTTFSVVLPSLNLVGGSPDVDTVGVVAVHGTGPTGIGHGQTTTYATVRLHGSARQVES